MVRLCMVYGHGQRAGSPARTNPLSGREKIRSNSAGGAELFQQRGAELHSTLWELKLKTSIKEKNHPYHCSSPHCTLPQLQQYKIRGCFAGGGLRARRNRAKRDNRRRCGGLMVKLQWRKMGGMSIPC